MNQIFRVGDCVRCVDDDYTAGQLVAGATYTVTRTFPSIVGTFVALDGGDFLRHPNRFVLQQPNIQTIAPEGESK